MGFLYLSGMGASATGSSLCYLVVAASSGVGRPVRHARDRARNKNSTGTGPRLHI